MTGETGRAGRQETLEQFNGRQERREEQVGRRDRNSSMDDRRDGKSRTAVETGTVLWTTGETERAGRQEQLEQFNGRQERRDRRAERQLIQEHFVGQQERREEQDGSRDRNSSMDKLGRTCTACRRCRLEDEVDGVLLQAKQFEKERGATVKVHNE